MPRPRVQDPADRHVSTYLNAAAVTELDKIAQAEGTSRAAVMRRAVLGDLVRRSRAEQGLGEFVDDPATLERVAQILRDGLDTP